MTDFVNENERIRSDQRAFMEAYERAREQFLAIDGVESVGFGFKQTGGTFTDNVAITVFVREKKPEGELAPHERIPPRFEGYLTDVRVIPVVTPTVCDNGSKYSTIQGGLQIVPKGGAPLAGGMEVGTLGCIVRKRGDQGRENAYLLSNKHVLYANGAKENDYVYHPDFVTGDALGPIQELSFKHDVRCTVPGLTPGSTVTDDFYLDCATARLDLDSTCCGSTCTKDTTKYDSTIIDLAVGVDDPATDRREDNTIADVRSIVRDVSIILPTGAAVSAGTPRVFKVGRTTGKTTGIIRSINAAGTNGTLQHNIIEIEYDPISDPPTHRNCHGNAEFAEAGDSGSVVVDENRRVIGLLFGGGGGTGMAYACHIHPVLDQLGICIACNGGTSYGSCAAIDGTGTAPNPLAVVDAPEAGIHFATSTTARRPATAKDITPPISITDDERVRLLVLRDALLETNKGRELHARFVDVRREIGYLIRNVRPVKVAWHRSRGPAFLVHTLNHVKGDADSIPLEIDGVSREQLLTRMARVLGEHGSNPLRTVIERYQSELIPLLSSVRRVEDCLASIGVTESLGAVATAAGP